MKILVESNTENLSPGFKFDLERRVGRVARKAKDSVERVRVTFVDLNGPKGGQDKQCKLKICLSGLPEVLIVSRNESIEKAFGEALRRADNALFRRLKKQQSMRARMPLKVADLTA